MAGWLRTAVETHVREMSAAVQEDAPQSAVKSGPAKEHARPELTDESHAEYERVAAAVGFAPNGLEADRLRRFLAESGMGVYDQAKVSAYLTELYGVAKDGRGSFGTVATWVWKPLRSVDSAWSVPVTQDEHFRSMLWQTRHSTNGAIAVEQTPYGKPVPLPVLLTVEKIATQFPTAKFYVSDDYKAPPIRDPFLAVQYGGALFVVERWDEPTFRG